MSAANIPAEKIEAVTKRILSFYEKNGRKKLPWRLTTDRYAIAVSEFMLQQTQVSRVVDKFKAWLKKFPTVKSLAEANLADVLAMWSGLGYNSRAKRLWECAKRVHEQHNDTFPSTVAELLKLPGIGPYTSRAILAFADNQDLAAVDTNIRRIIIHEFGLDAESATDKDIAEIAEKILPKGRARDWHNALMDYGSMVLTSKSTGVKAKTKQSKFAGSKRSFRGKIMKHLVEKKTITIAEAKKMCADCPVSVSELLGELVKEGLICAKADKTYCIA